MSGKGSFAIGLVWLTAFAGLGAELRNPLSRHRVTRSVRIDEQSHGHEGELHSLDAHYINIADARAKTFGPSLLVDDAVDVAADVPTTPALRAFGFVQLPPGNQYDSEAISTPPIRGPPSSL
jgi:hypothetical protein